MRWVLPVFRIEIAATISCIALYLLWRVRFFHFALTVLSQVWQPESESRLPGLIFCTLATVLLWLVVFPWSTILFGKFQRNRSIYLPLFVSLLILSALLWWTAFQCFGACLLVDGSRMVWDSLLGAFYAAEAFTLFALGVQLSDGRFRELMQLQVKPVDYGLLVWCLVLFGVTVVLGHWFGQQNNPNIFLMLIHGLVVVAWVYDHALPHDDSGGRGKTATLPATTRHML